MDGLAAGERLVNYNAGIRTMSMTEPRDLGLIPMVIEQSGRGERWNSSAGGADAPGTDAQDSGAELAAAIDVGAGAMRLSGGAFDWLA